MKNLRIKETILYYVVNWWYNSTIYCKFVLPILWFDKELEKYCETKEEALELTTRKRFKYVSHKYMIDRINEKFK